jgi:hypothetical protein
MYCRVLNWMSADVSEARAASIIRAVHIPHSGLRLYVVFEIHKSADEFNAYFK